MFKITARILLIFIVILLAGCSATRKIKTVADGVITGNANVKTLISNVGNYNITDEGFVIKKGKIELEGTETDGVFSMTARLNKKGDFMASVKGPLGIELVRILMVGNDIALISRLDRTVLVGKKDAVMNKNGVPESFMKILFGDLPADAWSWEVKSGEIGAVTLSNTDEKFNTETVICIDELKVCRERIRSSSGEMEINLEFSGFITSGESRYSSRIVLTDNKRMIRIRLGIDDFVPGYEDEIEYKLPDYRRENL